MDAMTKALLLSTAFIVPWTETETVLTVAHQYTRCRVVVQNPFLNCKGHQQPAPLALGNVKKDRPENYPFGFRLNRSIASLSVACGMCSVAAHLPESIMTRFRHLPYPHSISNIPGILSWH